MDASKLEFYTKRYDAWDTHDIKVVEAMYDNGNTIMNIAKELRKTPGQVAFKLKQIGILRNHMHATGYNEYVKSNLYGEIVAEGKSKDKSKKNKVTLETVLEQILKLQSDITDIKIKLDTLITE